ncbi:MAG: DNA primase [Deltaproteobacteria bacterium]|jgi:DNA primase|nr:DNA primase [Deltaproteobacteria bacterium]MBT4525813.1 DNA primase [Deltaproteobacteria bacterium]
MAEKIGYVSKEQIEQIIQSVDIVQLISGYVQIKSSGKNFIGLCPFHNEKTPSFIVSPSKQNYHCYGCGEFGNAIRFIMEVENFKFPEAVKYLADRHGILLSTTSSGKKENRFQNHAYQCIEAAFKFYRNNLKRSDESSKIQQYLKQRSISRDLVEKFQLAYAPSGWNNLSQYLNKNGFSESLQNKVGLIKQGEKGNFYDRMRNRLIFPIQDTQSRFLGFAGRVIGDDLPKYLNPPETQLYKKSNYLYGLKEAQNNIRKKNRIIIVEGYLDVIRLHEHSWDESVATCGTALHDNHIKLIKRLNVNQVYLLFDGDSAGIKAAEKAAQLFIKSEVDSKVIILPEGLDPDDYFKAHNNTEFQILIDQSSKDFEFIIQQSQKRAQEGGIEHQKTTVENMVELSKEIRSPIKRDLFQLAIAKAFSIDPKSVYHSVRSTNHEKKHKNISYLNQNRQFSYQKSEEHEVELIQYLIKQVQAITKIKEYVTPVQFSNPLLATLFSRLIKLTDEEYTSLKPQEFPEIFVEYSSLIMHLLQTGKNYTTDIFSETRLDEVIYRFKEQQMFQLQAKIDSAETEAETKKWLSKKNELRKEISHLHHRKKK